MTDDQKKKLKENFEKLLKKKVKFNFVIDPGVVGGFVAKVGDTVYDASLKNQLGNFKEAISKRRSFIKLNNLIREKLWQKLDRMKYPRY